MNISFNRPTGQPANQPTVYLCGLIFSQLERIGAEFFDLGRKLRGVFGKERTFTGRKIEHPGPFPANTDGIQNILGLLDPSFGHQVAGVKMTLAFQTSDDTGTVGAFFQGTQNVNHVDLSGAWDANDFNIRRILQSHRTCQVRGCVASEIAAKCNDDRLKIFAHSFPFSELNIED
jgi:hypothetical protein